MSTTTPTAPASADPRPSGRHPVNVAHLVMGVAFLGLVGIWALVQGDVVGGSDVRWLLPMPWVLAGLAGLLAIALPGRGRRGVRQTGWVPPGPGHDPAETPDVGADADLETDPEAEPDADRER